jgi:hypothetical protein
MSLDGSTAIAFPKSSTRPILGAMTLPAPIARAVPKISPHRKFRIFPAKKSVRSNSETIQNLSIFL